MGVAAVLLAQAALTALLVGIVLALAPLIGAALATLVVVLVAAGVIGLLAKLAMDRFQKIAGKIAARVENGTKP